MFPRLQRCYDHWVKKGKFEPESHGFYHQIDRAFRAFRLIFSHSPILWYDYEIVDLPIYPLKAWWFSIVFCMFTGDFPSFFVCLPFRVLCMNRLLENNGTKPWRGSGWCWYFLMLTSWLGGSLLMGSGWSTIWVWTWKCWVNIPNDS